MSVALAACAVAFGLGLSGPVLAQAGAWSLHGHWVASTPSIGVPSDAAPAGVENGGPVYVCRAIYNNAYVVGKVVGGYCYIPFNGAEIQIQQYEALGGQASESLWGPPGVPSATPLAADPYHPDIHVCRGNLIVGGAFVGQEPGMERGGQCLTSYRTLAYPVAPYQILYELVPMGSPNTWVTGPLPPPGPSPAPSPYPAPSSYPAAPPARTSEFMEGYATFGGACVGKADEHLQVRMAGRPDDERQLVLHGDGKLHMFVPRGTVARAYCGGWPDATVRYEFKAID